MSGFIFQAALQDLRLLVPFGCRFQIDYAIGDTRGQITATSASETDGVARKCAHRKFHQKAKELLETAESEI